MSEKLLCPECNSEHLEWQKDDPSYMNSDCMPCFFCVKCLDCGHIIYTLQGEFD